ncbi:MAG: carboxypeptidase-like regulatory domain-containing protein [bacterium]
MSRGIFASILVFSLALAVGCAQVRPAMFWQETRLAGKIVLKDEKGEVLQGEKLSDVTLNIINLSSKALDQASYSAVPKEDGSFEISGIPEGRYRIEVIKEGFNIADIEVKVESHEEKVLEAPIEVVKIPERTGSSIGVKEEEIEVSVPGEVNIQPPDL